MEVGDKVRVSNIINVGDKDATVVAITEKAIKIRYDDLPGVFTYSKRFIKRLK